MKREIKFRGKPSKDEPFVYGNLCKGVFGDALIQVTNGNNFINNVVVIEETVGQYTGVKDKNGVEIYEGDIVTAHDHPTGFDSAMGAVYYDQGCWKIQHTTLLLHEVGSGWLKVDGNIYENPELLPK